MRADQEVRNEPPGVGVAAERGWTIAYPNVNGDSGLNLYCLLSLQTKNNLPGPLSFPSSIYFLRIPNKEEGINLQLVSAVKGGGCKFKTIAFAAGRQ